MSDFNINEVIGIVKKNRKIFTSEADLQLEIAFAIKEKYGVKVYREFVPDTSDLSDEAKEKIGNMHIDILVVINEDEWIPIELKYKTKKTNYKDDTTGCVFNLKEQSAHDCGCYDYFKDIYRIEQIGKHFEQFREGYTIFITNDPLYLKGPLKKDNKEEANYAPFALAEKLYIESKKEYKWNKGAPSKDRERTLKFDGTYSFVWDDKDILKSGWFSKFNIDEVDINKSNQNALVFHILVNKIKKEKLEFNNDKSK